MGGSSADIQREEMKKRRKKRESLGRGTTVYLVVLYSCGQWIFWPRIGLHNHKICAGPNKKQTVFKPSKTKILLFLVILSEI